MYFDIIHPPFLLWTLPQSILTSFHNFLSLKTKSTNCSLCSSYTPACVTPIRHVHLIRSYTIEENSSSPVVSTAPHFQVEACTLFLSLYSNVDWIVYSGPVQATTAVCCNHFLYIGHCFTSTPVLDLCSYNLSSLSLLWQFLSFGKRMWYRCSICGWTLYWHLLFAPLSVCVSALAFVHCTKNLLWRDLRVALNLWVEIQI